jgi:riboflavin synthase
MPSKKEPADLDQLKIVLPHLLHHNEEHARDMLKWIAKANAAGATGAAVELTKAHAAMKKVGAGLRSALRELD